MICSAVMLEKFVGIECWATRRTSDPEPSEGGVDCLGVDVASEEAIATIGELIEAGPSEPAKGLWKPNEGIALLLASCAAIEVGGGFRRFLETLEGTADMPPSTEDGWEPSGPPLPFNTASAGWMLISRPPPSRMACSLAAPWLEADIID